MKFKCLMEIGWMLVFIFMAYSASAQDQKRTDSEAEELAQKLANPVASLINIPFQNIIDYRIGPYHGSRYTINFQPVIPFQLSKKLNLVTRWILPIVHQQDISGEGASQFGLSDATVSAFFAPAKNKNGVIWGAGPAFLFPVGTNDFLSGRKWGLGPTSLILRQVNANTYGFLMNQIWSVAGDADRKRISQMFLQPFYAYNFPSGAGLSLNSEMTFDWVARTSSIFINPGISAVTRLGSQIVSLAAGPKIPVSGPSETKPAFGFRASITLVLPR